MASEVSVDGGVAVGVSRLGTALEELLMADDIGPGAEPSYALCKAIYEFHPLGAKMVDSPIRLAQSQDREILVAAAPGERIVKAFVEEWDKLYVNRHIANTARTGRMYGVGSIAVIEDGVRTDQPLDYQSLWKKDIGFNVMDPLNTSGSLLFNQNPNDMNFQRTSTIRVQGQNYHMSRSCTYLNEDPLYIAYTRLAFGYTGRSVYQRALFPLKSFIQTMRTDDMIARKSGIIVAKIKQVGSFANELMNRVLGFKRNLIKEATTEGVLSIGDQDEVTSLDLTNLSEPYGMARSNMIQNIAVAGDMPAKLLNEETFAEGFGEGTEDAKKIARYVDGIRFDLKPLYDFFDDIVMWRAWSPEFYATIQADFPEYKGVDFTTAFYEWKNSFTARWPSLIAEPPSEKAKVDDIKLKAIIALLEVLLPEMDPENKTTCIQWACDNFNELKDLFGTSLILDYEALENYVPPTPEPGLTEPGEPKAFADTATLAGALRRLPARDRRALADVLKIAPPDKTRKLS